MTYEKLPDFCYGCGCLGHIIKECEDHNGATDEELPYGAWLREPTKWKIHEGDNDLRFGMGRGRGRHWFGGRGSWRKPQSDMRKRLEMNRQETQWKSER